MEVDKRSIDAPSSGNAGKGSHVTDLPFDPGQLHVPFAHILGFLKSSLLGLEASDTEFGVLDVVLAFSVTGDFHRKCPIVFFQ